MGVGRTRYVRLWVNGRSRHLKFVAEDAAVVIPLVHRLTNSSQLPVLLIGGKPVGFPSLTQNVVNPPGIIDQSMSAKSVFEHIRELHDNGELEKLIQSAGGIIGGGKKKKGKH